MNQVRIEIEKAKQLIKMRGYKLLEEESLDHIVQYLVKDPINDEKVLIWCVLSGEAVGIHKVESLEKTMESKNASRGIIIAQSVYTHAAGVGSKKKNIELISRNFPSFYLFDHILMPKHEILNEKKREELLQKYRIKPYQLPKIKSSDPAARAIGARPGDIIKITRDSPTAGKYLSYRYVIEG